MCNGGFEASGSMCLGTSVPVTEASCNSPSVREEKHIDELNPVNCLLLFPVCQATVNVSIRLALWL